MKTTLLFLLLCSLFPFAGYSQLAKDLDGDAVIDSVYFDEANSKIKCKLSSKQFVVIESKFLNIDVPIEIRATENGFEYSVNYMRAGFAHQFRYDTLAKRIQLIGMSKYELGPASNDGSGESSVNLLTNDYIGEWYYYDLRKEKLKKMPTIKMKMFFPSVYLEEYNGSCQGEYEEKCVELYQAQKKKMK